MIVMSKFPSIEQFRTIVRNVQHYAQYVRTEEDGTVVLNRSAPMPILKFVGTIKLHGCVSANTLITLADGSQECIKDITPGTSILSFNTDTNAVEFDTVNQVVIQELDKAWVELQFDNNTTLQCTQDHPILTTEGWVNAIDINEYHTLITDIL